MGISCCGVVSQFAWKWWIPLFFWLHFPPKERRDMKWRLQNATYEMTLTIVVTKTYGSRSELDWFDSTKKTCHTFVKTVCLILLFCSRIVLLWHYGFFLLKKSKSLSKISPNSKIRWKFCFDSLCSDKQVVFFAQLIPAGGRKHFRIVGKKCSTIQFLQCMTTLETFPCYSIMFLHE